MNTKVDRQPAPLAPAPQSPVGARVAHPAPGPNLEAPNITSEPRARLARGEAFKYKIEATNNARGFTADGLPPGLELDDKTGVISGKPDERGEFKVALAVENDHGRGSMTLTLTVE